MSCWICTLLKAFMSKSSFCLHFRMTPYREQSMGKKRFCHNWCRLHHFIWVFSTIMKTTFYYYKANAFFCVTYFKIHLVNSHDTEFLSVTSHTRFTPLPTQIKMNTVCSVFAFSLLFPYTVSYLMSFQFIILLPHVFYSLTSLPHPLYVLILVNS